MPTKLLIPEPDCVQCPRLVESRKAVVPGYGPLDAKILYLAQAPGSQEEEEGRPLIGWTGDRLRDLTEQYLGVKYEDCRLENVCACRPPWTKTGDKPPTVAEWDNCREFVLSVIRRVKPEYIITLGNVPLKWFFPDRSLKTSHGQILEWTDGEDIYLVVPSYHPAAAAPRRNPGLAATIIQDFKVLGDKLQGKNKLGKYWEATPEEAYEYLRTAILNGHRSFAFDLETTDAMWKKTFQARRVEITGWSICVQEGEALYVFGSIEPIREFLEDPGIRKIAHNSVFEYLVCLNAGITVRNLDCTKTMAYTLNMQNTSLKNLAWDVFQIVQTRFDHVDWRDRPGVVQYAGADSDITKRLDRVLSEALWDNELWAVYLNEDLPLIEPLTQMQMDGFRLDVRPLGVLKEKVLAKQWESNVGMDEFLPDDYEVWSLEEGWKTASPRLMFNWNSPLQLAHLLYDPPRWQAHPKGVGKTRRITFKEWPKNERYLEISEETIYQKSNGDVMAFSQALEWRYPGLGIPDLYDGSTDMNTLRLIMRDPFSLNRPYIERFCRALIEYSTCQGILSKEVSRLPDLIQEDGRIHPSYHMAGAHEEASGMEERSAPITGRVSASGPNPQNMLNHGDTDRPYMQEWGNLVAQSIAAEPGRVFVKADVSKEEPNIAAWLSQDPVMLYELAESDPYRPAAAAAFGCRVEDVNPEQRQIGKRMWMAWLNRAGVPGIQRSAFWMSDVEVRTWLNWMAGHYRVFEYWCWKQVAFLRKNGYVLTHGGRRVPYPAIQTNDRGVRIRAEMACIPGKIQGTGGDIVRLGLRKTYDFNQALEKETGLYCRLLRTVHDEITTECHEILKPLVIAHAKELCHGLFPLPLETEVKYGYNLGELTDA